MSANSQKKGPRESRIRKQEVQAENPSVALTNREGANGDQGGDEEAVARMLTRTAGTVADNIH